MSRHRVPAVPLMEALEDRLMLSTTITCTPTSINIAADNIKTGAINVAGLNGAPYTVSVAGETPVIKGTLPVVSSQVSVTVSTGNAGRVVNITAEDTRNVTVKGGDGNDTITVGGRISGNVALNGGKGTNTLATAALIIRGNVSITGGAGADTIRTEYIYDSLISGSLTINAGDGTNSVTLETTYIFGALTVNGGKDVDTVTLGGAHVAVFSGKGSINTKAGNDRIFFNLGAYGSTPFGKPTTLWTIAAGDGDDDIRLGGATAAWDVHFQGNLKLDAGAGNDTLKVASNLFGGDVEFWKTTTILMGAGNDEILFASLLNGNDVIFTGNTVIDLGASLTSGPGDRIGVSVGCTSQLSLNGTTTINLGAGIKDLVVPAGIRALSIFLGQSSRTQIKASTGATISSDLKWRLLQGINATAPDVGYLIGVM